MNICISENLRALRSKSGYTLEQVAEIVDVSRQTIAKWEIGETLPDIINCVKLATLFKVTLDEFVVLPVSDTLETTDCDENNGQVMGVVNVGNQGQINIPEEVLKLFNIENGEKMILLADKKQGIAIVKCNQF